jgi:hypothetical protein
MAITNIPNVLWGDGDDNMGGLRTICYWALHSDFTTSGHPTPDAATRDDATNIADLVTITTAPTFKSGKGWKKLYVTEDKAMLESAQQGERDGKSFSNKVKLFHPGNSAQVMGLISYINNAGCYFLPTDAEGQKRLIGSEHYPAKINTLTITTAETAAGLKGVTFEAQCSSPRPAPVVKFTVSVEASS